MKKHSRYILAASFIAAALAAGAWFVLHDWFPSVVTPAIRGELRAITFRPYSQSDGITVTDPAMMDSIRAAIKSARRPHPIASYPLASNPIIFEFTDGRKEEMLLSWVAAGPEALDETAHSSLRYSYAMLKWNGYKRIVDNAPFLAALPRMEPEQPAQPSGVELEVVRMWRDLHLRRIPKITELPEDVDPRLETQFIVMLETLSLIAKVDARLKATPNLLEEEGQRVQQLIHLLDEEAKLLEKWSYLSGDDPATEIKAALRDCDQRTKAHIRTLPGGGEAIAAVEADKPN